MQPATIPTIDDYLDFGIRAGVSARAMLRLYREAGGRIRNGDWLRLWNERRALWAARAA